MAVYTTEDRNALASAIASGASKVRYSDGREVTFRSLVDMRAELARADEELGLSTGTKIKRNLVQFAD